MLGIGIFLYANRDQSTYVVTTTELGFPLTLVNDEKFSEFYSWKGRVLISVNDYSKENLEKIFAWYSTRHPKETGTIMLDVYTNEKELDRMEPICSLPESPIIDSNRPSTSPYNASYIRDERDGSEYYGYQRDPVKKNKSETVFLRKGKNWK
jgi:hypothetical protein